MHESTKRVFKKHGWRVDRAIHNYVYFAYYYPYVKTVYHGLRFLTGYLAWFKPLSAEFIPDDSILREFIGGSILETFRVWGA